VAVRIRSTFHTEGQRSPTTLASVVAALAFKLAVESIKSMRKADYDIDVGRPYFDYFCEFLIFMALAADRIAYMRLDAEQRVEFTSALAKRLSEIIEDNNHMLLGEAEADACRRHFIELFNRRSGEYAEFDYGPDGPDFGFKRLFAACLREGLPEKDRLWVVDQAMDIEVPEALKALDKTLAGLFGFGAPSSRRRQPGEAGE
jgi:hypothetical protein